MHSSTIDNAISSTKSFIESFTSSDNPTTTFTEHTVASVVNNDSIVSKILGFISQPKFKWYILGLLLCVVAFVYFKFQNKNTKQNENTMNNVNTQSSNEQNNTHKDEINTEKNDIENVLADRDKLWISKINEMKQDFNNQLVRQADINSQLVAQLNNAQNSRPLTKKQRQRAHQSIQQPTIIKNTQNDSEHLTETSNSEEIFIEDKNVMEHNLTAEEMNAIDKQLEDVNLDHLMHASE